jgi:hypothetical protein
LPIVPAATTRSACLDSICLPDSREIPRGTVSFDKCV